MFVTVANCSSIQQAYSFKIALDAVEIESFIPDEISAGLAPHHFTTPAGVRLQVRQEDLEAAQEAIRQYQAPSDDDFA